MKKVMVGLLIVFSLVFVGCTDATLTKVATALNDTALAVGGLQNIVITANKQGTLSDADMQNLLGICYRINAAGLQASTVTRNVAKLTPADRSNLLNILQPVVNAVADNIATLGITNPTIKKDVMAALLAVQTGLTTAQLILSGGK